MREPTRPFWLDGVPGQDVGAGGPPPARADVVVIGGGITGASAAYWLGAHGIAAVVLVTVRTERGDIATPVVVHAENAWARRLVPALDGVIVPVRGQVIVTAPAPPLWTFGLSTNFGYEYWMQRPDGRVVLGGVRWLTPSQEVATDHDTVVEPQVSAALHAFLPRHFPDLAGVPVEREWTGIMGFTPDRAPLVGPLPGSPGEYVAAGFHGHGMPMAFYAARAVAEMIAGKEPEHFVPDAFLPGRFLR